MVSWQSQVDNEGAWLSQRGSQMPAPNPAVFVADSFFRVARNATVNVYENVGFNVEISAHVTSGPAPLGVVFDGHINSAFPGITRPLHELSFHWVFGDTGATFKNISVDHPFGNDANTAMGAFTGHVFESVGSYVTKLYVYDHVSKRIGYAAINIDATDADAFFATTKTVCLSTAGDFTDKPDGATEVTTWTAAKTALQITGDKRLLIRYGETVLVDVEMDHRRDGIKHYAGFGTIGDGMPILRSETKMPLGIFYVRLFGHATIYDINFEGSYTPVTGLGESYFTPGVYQLTGDDCTVFHCKMRGLRELHNIAAIITDGGNIAQDNDVSDWGNFALYGDYTSGVARGNLLKQNPLSVSGLGGKSTDAGSVGFSEIGDGVKVAFSHGLDMFGDAPTNLAVFKRVISTGALTEMVVSVDYTATNPGSGDLSGVVTYTVAPLVTEDAYMYHRRWADHGPIRTIIAKAEAIVQNDMASYNGWTTSGAPAGEGAIQPCIRNNSNTELDTSAVINMNRCQGGFTPIHTGPANGDGQDNLAQDCIIESNYIICDDQTWAPISAMATGTTVRNNVAMMPDVLESTASRHLFSLVQYGAWAGSTTEVKDLPVRIYNNTLINLQSTANGATDLLGETSLEGSSVAPTDFAQDNNLVYFPDSPTPWPDYTPLDLNNYGVPTGGSSAIDVGTEVNDICWDDFHGDVRGELNTEGAGGPLGYDLSRWKADSVSLAESLGRYFYVEPGHSGANNGTLSDPFSTSSIKTLITKYNRDGTIATDKIIKKGDILICRNGDYLFTEFKVYWTPEDYPITIRADEGHNPEFRGMSFYSSRGFNIDGISINTKGLVTNRVFYIFSASGFLYMSSDISVKNCYLRGFDTTRAGKTATEWNNETPDGFYIRNSTNILIENNYIENCDNGIGGAVTDHALFVDGVAPEISLKGNIIDSFIGDGIKAFNQYYCINNIVKNSYTTNNNHDDAFQINDQSNISNINMLVVQDDGTVEPALAGTLQGYGNFDGSDSCMGNGCVFDVDSFHAVSFYSAYNGFVNNCHAAFSGVNTTQIRTQETASNVIFQDCTAEIVTDNSTGVTGTFINNKNVADNVIFDKKIEEIYSSIVDIYGEEHIKSGLQRLSSDYKLTRSIVYHNRPKGLYVTGGSSGVSQAVIDHVDVSGILVQSDWADIEATEGVFDWTAIDAKIAPVTTAGKGVKFSLHIGGLAVPQWITDMLIINGGSVKSVKVDHQGTITDIPAFWDALYIEKKVNFYRELANRYGNNDTVKGISVSMVDPITGDWGIFSVDTQSMVDAGYDSDGFAQSWYNMTREIMLLAPAKMITTSIGTTPQTVLDLIGSAEDTNYAFTRFLDLMKADSSINMKRFAGGKGSLHAQTPDPDQTSDLGGWDVMAALIDEYGGTGFAQTDWNVTQDPGYRMNGGIPYGGAGEDTIGDVLLNAATVGSHFPLSWIEPWDDDIENSDAGLQTAIASANALYPQR